MTEPRIAARVLVDAIRRLVEGEGGQATVLGRGDETAGAILVVVRDRSGGEHAFERRSDWLGSSTWGPAGPSDAPPAAVAEYLRRRRVADPDLWVVEIEGISDPQGFLNSLSS